MPVKLSTREIMSRIARLDTIEAVREAVHEGAFEVTRRTVYVVTRVTSYAASGWSTAEATAASTQKVRELLCP